MPVICQQVVLEEHQYENDISIMFSSTQSAASAEGSSMENENRAAFSLTRRIGSTNYLVNVHCSESTTETIEDKIIRLIRSEAVEISPECGIMDAPQTSRRSERSAL